MKIVIVEDEIRIREGIVGLIRKNFSENYEIREASNGEEGLKIIREIKPDLVITDVRMGLMDGLEMLTTLVTQDHLVFKTIILSAYSEFDYAKQAISLGVKEYIIKPIDVNEFINIIKRLEDEIIHDKLVYPELLSMLNSIESIFHGLLLKKLIFGKEIGDYIEKKYFIKPDCLFFMHYLYFGKIEIRKYNLILQAIKTAYKSQTKQRTAFFPFPDENAILCIYYDNWEKEYLEAFCENTIMEKINLILPDSAFSITDWFIGIESMYDSFENLKNYLQWGVSLGNTLISLKSLQSLKKLIAPYPMQIEKDSISCLCAKDKKGLHEQVKLFLRNFSGNYYSPDSIKKCCIRYFLAVLQIMREFYFAIYETINEQEVLDEIKAAKSVKELENTLTSVIILPSEQNEIQIGVLVKKVMRMVEEHYKNGITLKEIANQLGLSPDYISVQFTHELGMNFSTYIKKYRIRKAKELLVGTNLKIFDVAHRIGINDPKYFSRVFKEAEGIHPADYRKKYR